MPSSYRTIDGDAFDSIAYRLWQDESLAQYIIAANPEYADVVIFEAGAELTIPDVDRPVQVSSTLPPWMEG